MSASFLGALFLVSCGGEPEGPEEGRDRTEGGEVPFSTGREVDLEDVLVLAEPAPVPEGPRRVAMGRIRLRAGERLRVPSGPCQDVMVLVRAGTVEAAGTGIAPRSVPVALSRDRAARFGPEGDGLLSNPGREEVRLAAVFVRADRHRLHGPSAMRTLGSPPDDCPVTDAGPTRTESRIVRMPEDHRVTPDFTVRVLFDGPTAGAHLGSLSVLTGTEAAAVPEHTHAASDEVLFVEKGAGAMRLGRLEASVRPARMLYVPSGTVHDYRPDGSAPLLALQTYAPSGPEQRFLPGRTEDEPAGDPPGTPVLAPPAEESGEGGPP